MRILTLFSFVSLWVCTNGISAQSINTGTNNNTLVADGVIIHEAQGVEKTDRMDEKSAVPSNPEQKWNREQLVSIMNDCEQKMKAAADPKDKERYASELLEIKKKIAFIETGKEK